MTDSNNAHWNVPRCIGLFHSGALCHLTRVI